MGCFLAQDEDSGFTAGKSNWRTPAELTAGSCLKPAESPIRRHQRQPAVGPSELGCGGKRPGHFLDGSDGHTVELLTQSFSPIRMDLRRNPEYAHCFLEERGLFALRLGQRDGYLRTAKRDGNSGQTCAGTKIEQC